MTRRKGRIAPVALLSLALQGAFAAAAAQVELLPNARTPEEGLLSGGQPSPEQLLALRDAGYLTIVNLRTEGEAGSDRAEVEELGLSYVALPIDAEGLTEENARAFAAILDQVERPAVVHCGSGNRVGALFALKAFYVDGASAGEAVELGLAAGLTKLEPSVREHLAAAAAAAADDG